MTRRRCDLIVLARPPGPLGGTIGHSHHAGQRQSGDGAPPCTPGSAGPDRGGRGRQPEPHRGQCRAARHRPGLRHGPDRARPDRHRLLARPGRLGALPGRGGRPSWPPHDARARRAAVHPGLPDSRLRPGRWRAAGCPPARRDLRRHGLPHHPGPDHRALVGTGPDPGYRPVVWSGRRDHVPGAPDGRPGPALLLVGISVPAHPAAGRGGPDPGAGRRAVTRQRDHRPRGQSGRGPVDGFRCGPGSCDQFRRGAGRGDPGHRHGSRGAGRGGRLLRPPAAGPASPL